MYTPAQFVLDDPSDVRDALRLAGFGHLVTGSCSNGSLSELASTSLPFVVDDQVSIAQAHFARANTHWRTIDGGRALLIVPVSDSYVSPGWYPSKKEDGKVVPTWNYELIHLHGTVEIKDDPGWLLNHVKQLTDLNEECLHGASDSQMWKVDDAPEEFIQAKLKGIVGVRLNVERAEAKRKLSQNRSASDQAGVREGLEHLEGHRSEGVRLAMTNADQ